MREEYVPFCQNLWADVEHRTSGSGRDVTYVRVCVCVKERHCAKEINRSHIWQAQNAAGRTSSLNTDHVLLIQR